MLRLAADENFNNDIPPGQIFKGQLLKQGEIAGQKIAQNPDVYASVNIDHLRQLRGMNLMDDSMIYVHNKLELMVAAGNPKHIEGPEDLGCDDLMQSHPNPLTEGTFSSMARRCSRTWACTTR